ncbi:MAG: GNAT family N-acetyltransferase [Acidimicrobiales bacterium]
MPDLLTIGELSARCGLSVKVLRTYADAGVLAPVHVDPSSGYRYYEPGQQADAEIVALLRRAGVPVADIGRFLTDPSGDALDGWERSMVAEMHGRREALAAVRCRLGEGTARTRGGATTIEVRPVRSRDELRVAFDLAGAELPEPIDHGDARFVDLDRRFPDDHALMVVATIDGTAVGGALAFRQDDGTACLRILAVVAEHRHRGIGRRLVEHIEAEARRNGAARIALGTDEAVGFWFHLGYQPHLLFQWVYDPERFGDESEAVLAGPLRGLKHWRSSFNEVPQLFVELDEPRLDLRHTLRESVTGAHVGFMMLKRL